MESRNVNLVELIFDGIIKPRDVKLSDLERITQNFSEQRIIGEGGFAKVYKGVLRNGEVAVKRIRNDKTIDERLFQREVSSLLNVSHKNIVRFIGFCSHTVHKALEYEGQYVYAEHRDRILCFEYINNGSLEKYIADELRGIPWDTRVLVIKGICEGLQYLHMKRKIIHRDLKPANILIDNNMVAKITDFGLSRMEENAQTKSTTRVSSPGYTSPEYIDKGEMSVKYDVYSLGVIIIELVTGHRSIPDSNSVLRRWRHRLRKSGKETPFIYQQIAKLIEIGLLCQEKDPYKRPFISDIMDVMNELESTDWQVSNANESASGQISPYLEDDMLGIEPLELCFPFKTNSQLSCSIELTNKTNAFIAFSIQTTSPLPYCIQPKKDTVAPRSKYSVNITLQSLNKAPQDRGYTGDFIVRSTKVNESLTGEDITEDAFNREEGKLVDEVNLTITYKAEVPQVDVSLGSLIISDMRNLHSPQESDVRPTEAESKITSSTSVELIKFEPPVVSFPFLRSKCLLSSIKIVNITDSHIGFNTDAEETNVALYITEPPCGVLPPWSTQELVVKRVAKEEAPKMQDIQCNDKYFVWSCFVTEDVSASDLTRYMPNTERKELPIVFTETSSNELIKFDPPELCLPLLPIAEENELEESECKEKLQKVKSLITSAPDNNDITRSRDPPPVKSMHVDPAPIPPSRSVILEEALRFIKSSDPNEGMVLMWGPDKDEGTNLLKKINNSFLEENPFHFVIFVTSPSDCSVTNVQAEIISRLSMRQDGDEVTRATRLCEQLENKNFLVIVDNLRQNLDLEAVGIPYPLGFVEGKKRKVVIMSLSGYRSVGNLMGVNKDIELPILQEEEARELFRQSINYQGDLYSDLNIGPHATDLVRAINGLPSELVRYGKSMRGTADASSWKVAIDDAASKFSRLRSIEDTLRLIEDDPTLGVIGIWGPSGVGKTHLLKKIQGFFRGRMTVIWVTASKECSVLKVQTQILDELKLKGDGSVGTQGGMIHDYLQNRNFLVLLDDLWKRIDLELVGIPHPLGIEPLNKFKRKIVLTTRFTSVCGGMEVKKQIKVPYLKDNEAWELFREKVGDQTIFSPGIEDRARILVTEMKGLPLALVTVGRAMYGKIRPDQWDSAIQHMKKSCCIDTNEDPLEMEKEVFRKIMFSYDNLKSKRLKKCFLTCALWPEDQEIDREELAKCWTGLGLVDVGGHTRSLHKSL